MGDQRERERLSEEPNQAERVRVSEAVNEYLCQEHGPAHSVSAMVSTPDSCRKAGAVKAPVMALSGLHFQERLARVNGLLGRPQKRCWGTESVKAVWPSTGSSGVRREARRSEKLSHGTCFTTRCQPKHMACAGRHRRHFIYMLWTIRERATTAHVTVRAPAGGVGRVL